MFKLFRRLKVWMLGAPVCSGCAIYKIDCIGYCTEDEQERIDKYINEGSLL